MVRMDENCEQYRSLKMAYNAAQRLICLKYSNQGDDYIREALQNLKESYAAGKLTWKKRLLRLQEFDIGVCRGITEGRQDPYFF